MLDVLADWVFGGVGQAGVAVAFIAAALYWRRALGLGRVLSTWGGRVVFATASIGVLMLAGVIPTLNLGRAADLGATAVASIRDLWPLLRAALEGVL